GPAEDPPPGDPEDARRVGGAREYAGGADQEDREADAGGPPPGEPRAPEPRPAVDGEQHRQQKAGEAAGPEQPPPDPPPNRPAADRADGARLVERVEARIEAPDGHHAEPGERQRQDALGLAHPAARLAPRLLGRSLPGRRTRLASGLFPGGERAVGHQTSRIT